MILANVSLPGCALLGAMILATGAAPAQVPAIAQAPGQGAPAAPRRVGPPLNRANPLPYDLLLQNGRVIDAKNNIDRVTDVAIKNGRIAAVADHLNAKDAAKTIDVSSYIVTPGLIDLHEHLYAVSGFGPLSKLHGIWPDGYSFRNGVTTVVDAGTSGWRTFPDFKEHIIDRSKTRVLADLNIVGWGMDHASHDESDLSDMDGEITAYTAKSYPGVIVGIKSAHFTGPEWKPYVEAVKAGNIANIPVMIDYGTNRIERPLYDLLTKYLRPGDIYTHTYSGLRGEQDTKTLLPSQALLDGRKRGIYFDVGTGNGSILFRVAVPLIKAGFVPDSISTDLHYESSIQGTKDLLNVMDMFMAMGLSLQQVVADTTWHPAQEIKQTQLGHLSVGAPADVAVFTVDHGNFGFFDVSSTKLAGDTRLRCELTLRDGRIVYDLDGLSMDLWNQQPTSDPQTAGHWTAFPSHPALPEQLTPAQK